MTTYLSKLRLCNLLYFTHLPTIVNVQNELRSAKRQIHKVHIFKVSFPFTIFLEFLSIFTLFFLFLLFEKISDKNLICLLICGPVLLRTLAPQLNCLEAEKQNILGFCSAISCLAQQVNSRSICSSLAEFSVQGRNQKSAEKV